MGKKKIGPVLCDSNVLFGYLNGDEATRKAIDKIGHDRIAFSVITTSEAYAGCNKVNFVMLKKVFKSYLIFHINEDVSKIFNGLIQNHHSRHSKWIPDALIAATAISNNIELFTYNKKDFDFIPGLKLYNPK
jgi:predicted nucleic acid-binding protein